MSIEEAEKLVPEETKAAIALLKKGTFGRSLISTVVRAVIYMLLGAYFLGEFKVKIDVIEANLFSASKKIDVIIDNQNTDHVSMNDFRNELISLQYYTGFKKTK